MVDNFQGALANQNPKVILESDQTEPAALKEMWLQGQDTLPQQKEFGPGVMWPAQPGREVELGRGMNTES